MFFFTGEILSRHTVFTSFTITAGEITTWQFLLQFIKSSFSAIYVPYFKSSVFRLLRKTGSDGDSRTDSSWRFQADAAAAWKARSPTVTYSPVHTVAEKCDCRRKRRDNGEIRRLSHFFRCFRRRQIVALFCGNVDRAYETRRSWLQLAKCRAVWQRYHSGLLSCIPMEPVQLVIG